MICISTGKSQNLRLEISNADTVCKFDCAEHIHDDEDDDNDVGYFVQPETILDGANTSTNESLVEEYRYHADNIVFNGSHLSAELSLYKDPISLSRLGFPLRNFTHSESPAQFVFVIAADDGFFHVAMDAIGLVQLFFPNHTIYFYDLSGGVLDIKADKVNKVLLY